MYRPMAPVYHPCTECGIGLRRRHIANHMAMSHPERPSRWARLVAWLRGLTQHWRPSWS